MDTPTVVNVLLCIHGLKSGHYHDFDTFEQFAKQRPDIVVVKVNLYDFFDPKTYPYKQWLKKVDEVIQPYLSEPYKLHVIAYSMSAGVAAYLGSRYPLASMTLIAPYFHLLGTQLFRANLRLFYKYWKLKLTRKKDSRRDRLIAKMVPIPLMFQTMRFVLYGRRFVRKISCPIQVISGLKDDYISFKSVEWAYFQSQSQSKKLIFDDHLDHLFLFDLEKARPMFQEILLFIN